jgi:hypothetical protein
MSDSKKGHEEDDESFESLMQFEKKQMKKVQPLKEIIAIDEVQK